MFAQRRYFKGKSRGSFLSLLVSVALPQSVPLSWCRLPETDRAILRSSGIEFAVWAIADRVNGSVVTLINLQFTTRLKIVDTDPQIRRTTSDKAGMVGMQGDSRDIVLSLDVLS